MCGICGWVRWEGGAETDPVLRMARRLTHRGPDGEGVWRDSTGRAVLGHRRLAVLDTSPAAAQPMAASSGHCLVYNGECYAFAALRRELEREGAAFRSSGDTEVVLELLRRRGAAALEAMDGMFALAFWDPAGRLLLARDRLGIKPLFWAEAGGGLVFASELPALLEHPAVGRRLDREALGRWLQLGYVPGDRTLIDGVRILEPGAMLEAVPGGIAVRRWYDPLEAARRGDGPASAGEAAEALEALVRDAVRRRLVADVPLGCFLSSGVDSATVAAAAAASLPDGGLETLTVRFEDGEDESPDAASVARRLGARASVETLDPGGMLAFLEAWPRVAGDPFADPSLAPTALVCAAARRRWVVALSGDGGDELFSGYPRLRAMPALERALRTPRAVRRVAGAVAPAGRRWGRKLREALDAPGPFQAYQALQGVVPRRVVAALLGETPPEPWPSRILRRLDGLPGGVRWRALDLVTFLPARVLAKVDRASMAHGLEVRVPLLDHRIAELALSLPGRLVRSKALLRTVLDRMAPGLGGRRRKIGFEVPLESWLRGPLRPAVRDALDGGGLEALGLDPEPAREMAERQLAGDAALAEPVFALWTLVRWDAAVRRI